MLKSLLKRLGDGCAWLCVAPLAHPVAWLAPLDGRHLIFQCASQAMSLLPGLPGVYLRRAFYRIALGLESRGFVVEFGTIFAQRGTFVGNHVYIGPFGNIGLSTIEDDVLIGSNVDIVSGRRTHHFERTDVPIREQGGELEQIRIGKGSWIGNKAVVMATLGDGCIVGAGAVVTRPFEAGTIVGGNPAREIRSRVEAQG